MKTNMILALMVSSLIFSCGKKETVSEPSSSGIVDSLSTKKAFETVKPINEETCIDEVMQKDLGEKEVVKKVLADSDINFCNGLRVRVKIFKTSGDDIRIYGFAQSSTGKLSCLKNARDVKKLPFLGYQGTLTGNGVKISLGGHQYTSENKLISSDHLKAKYVKFDVASYSGEMGFFENDNLKCWAIH